MWGVKRFEVLASPAGGWNVIESSVRGGYKVVGSSKVRAHALKACEKLKAAEAARVKVASESFARWLKNAPEPY